MIVSNDPAIWILLMTWALFHADQDAPTIYISRIDGMLFPHCPEHLA